MERNQLLLETAEERAAREVAQVYSQARSELLDLLISRWTGTSTLSPLQNLDLLRRLGLLQAIDARLAELEQKTGRILGGIVNHNSELAVEQIMRELALLPAELRPDLTHFALLDPATIEQFTGVVVGELPGITAAASVALKREIQNGLIQGQSFPEMVRRVMRVQPGGEGPAVWNNSRLSAERLVRRTVITANNQSKQGAMAAINRGGNVKIQKQAVATIGPRTTRCCLRVHGQIRDVDKPFDLTAEPHFARQMMTPAFHWFCRTSVAMYHPVFEQGNMTTASMRASAAAELNRRDSDAGTTD